MATGDIRPKDLTRVTSLEAGDAFLIDGDTTRSIAQEDVADALAIPDLIDNRFGAVKFFPTVASFEATNIPDNVQYVFIERYYSGAAFGNPGGHWCLIQNSVPGHYAYHTSSNGKYAVMDQDYLTFEMFGGKAFTDGTGNTDALNRFMSYSYATGRATLNFGAANYYFKERPWAYQGNPLGMFGLNFVGAGKEMTRIYNTYAEDDDHGFFHILPNKNGGQFNIRDLSILSMRTTFGGCAIYAIDGNRTDITLSGTITAGDTISVNIRYSSTDHIVTYTVLSTDNLNSVSDALDFLIRSNTTLRDTDGFRTAVYDNILFIIGDSAISTTITTSTSVGATITGTVGTTNLYTCGYLHFQNLDISSSNGWTIPIYVDGDRHPGSPQGLRSIYLTNVQSFGGQNASMQFKGVVHLSLLGCETVLAGGTSGSLYISGKTGAFADTISIVMPQVGGDLSLDCVQQFSATIGEIAGNVVLDHVNNANINAGLIAGSITNTSNTVNVSVSAALAGSVQSNWINSHFMKAGNAVLLDVAQTLTNKTFSKPIIIGRTDGGAAASGNVGEVISSTLASGSATSLTSGTAKTITSISLTAGEWEVDAIGHCFPANTTSLTGWNVSISQTNNTLDPTPGHIVGNFMNATAFPSGVAIAQGVPPLNISLSTTTTIYLVMNATFTVSTCAGFGIIRARRVQA